MCQIVKTLTVHQQNFNVQSSRSNNSPSPSDSSCEVGASYVSDEDSLTSTDFDMSSVSDDSINKSSDSRVVQFHQIVIRTVLPFSRLHCSLTLLFHVNSLQMFLLFFV